MSTEDAPHSTAPVRADGARGSSGAAPSKPHKPCRACAEQIHSAAKVCHICGTPQDGPLWLYRWKDVATAVVAVLALVPWLAGAYTFVVQPVLFPPAPQLVTVASECAAHAVTVTLANAGDAIAFVRRAYLTRANGPVISLSNSAGALGSQSAIEPGKVNFLALTAFEKAGGSSVIADIDPDLPRCALSLNIDYEDAQKRTYTAAPVCACSS